MRKTLRLILGDQLNASHSWLENTDQNILYVLMEMRQETDYVRHHTQKVEEAAVSYWQDHEDQISLSQVEGFVRQIIGRRELVQVS